MFNIFDSTVLIEIGQAIGNVGGKLFKKPARNAEIVDEAFRSRLASGVIPPLHLGDDAAEVQADQMVDTTYRVLDKEE